MVISKYRSRSGMVMVSPTMYFPFRLSIYSSTHSCCYMCIYALLMFSRVKFSLLWSLPYTLNLMIYMKAGLKELWYQEIYWLIMDLFTRLVG